jgi:hypothetical protein
LMRNAEETTPPLFFLLLRGWWSMLEVLSWDHPTAAALRGLTVALDLVILGVLLVMARRHAGLRTARISGLLYAVHPLAVHFAQDLRMYTLGALLATLCCWGLLEVMRLRRRAHGRGAGIPAEKAWWALFSLAAAGMVLTHYVLVLNCLVLGAIGLGVFFSRRDGRGICHLIVASAFAALLTVPWLALVAGAQGTVDRSGATWMEQPLAGEMFRALWHEWWLGPTGGSPDELVRFVNLGAILVWVLAIVGGWGSLGCSRRRLLGFLFGICTLSLLLVWLPGNAGLVLLNLERTPAFLTPLFCLSLGLLIGRMRSFVLAGTALGMAVILLLQSQAIQQVRTTWSWFDGSLPLLAQLQPQVLFVGDEYMVQGLKQHGPELTDPPRVGRVVPLVRRVTEAGSLEIGSRIWREFVSLDPSQPVAATFYDRPDTEPRFSHEVRNLLELTIRQRYSLAWHVNLDAVAGRSLGPIRGGLEGWERALPAEELLPYPLKEQDEVLPPDDVLGWIQGFRFRTVFHGRESDGRRWSKPLGLIRLPGWQAGDRFRDLTTVTVYAKMPPRFQANYAPQLRLRSWRTAEPSVWREAAWSHWTSAPLALEVAVPPGESPVMIGWSIQGVNPKKMGVSTDDRDLGLHWYGVGLRYKSPARNWWQGQSGMALISSRRSW